MPLSGWLCTKSTKNMLVKIVHPGGHVELHDRPILAGEIMLRNPRCCVAYPHVFQQPWAVATPETTLMLGQKYYVVPLSTIRKLQRLSRKYSPSASPSYASQSPSPTYNLTVRQTQGQEGVSTRRFLQNNGTYACLEQSDDESQGHSTGSSSSARKRAQRENDGEECFSKDNCFAHWLTRKGPKANSRNNPSNESRSTENHSGTSETRELIGQNKLLYTTTRRGTTGAPRRSMSSESWQPSLDSITEEEQT